MGGVGKDASYYSVVKAYEHELGDGGEHFTAFNMTFGAFGNVQGKHLLCVQVSERFTTVASE